MKISNASTALTASLLLLGLCMQTASAHTGGGGHSGGGGGGHSYSGHSGGGGHVASAHYAARGGYSGAHYATSYAGSAHVAAAAPGYGGRAAVAPGYGGRGYANIGGARYARPGGWGGGYWGGRYWPGVYYGAGFAWFLPVLPLYCATYYWNGLPYYYYNDAYYTWSPSADGYVATDPPPSQTAGGPNDAPPATYTGGDQAGPPPPGAPGAGSDNVFAYPSQGQSEEQQASDRQECAQWAGSQAGGANGSPDYHRALIACFQGRGYSAQ
jgi:hypothetical protein